MQYSAFAAATPSFASTAIPAASRFHRSQFGLSHQAQQSLPPWSFKPLSESSTHRPSAATAAVAAAFAAGLTRDRKGRRGYLRFLKGLSRRSRLARAAGPELPRTYDPVRIAQYWDARGGEAFGRVMELASDLQNTSFLKASAGGVELVQTTQAAEELADLLIRWGATFVKIGQAVAVRTDILPETYTKALQKLFEGVPPSSSVDARGQVEKATGKKLEDMFVDVRAFDKPIAAASVGQVYKAELKDGNKTVAVKIRRQNILEKVTLDMYIIRSTASLLARFGPSESLRESAQAFVELTDTAYVPFVEELDFSKEAKNQARFRELVAESELIRDSVTVPEVYFAAEEVLIQGWVDGVKISALDITSDEGRQRGQRLVRTLLNSYMVQFLETGFLHGDPHPGNFLVTTDGRLCILDFGLMQEITKEQQVSFIEYIMHLTVKEYDACLEDLIRLDFLDDGIQNDPRKDQILVALADTLDTIYGDGKSFTPEKVEKLQNQKSRLGLLASELDEIAKEYPLRVPPYFILVLRAFGTLEGLGIQVDDDFAVLDGLFPYMARRLVTDDDPRIRSALLSFLYGSNGKLSISRLQRLSRGFGSFTNEMKKSPGDSGSVNALATAAPSAAQAAALDAATVDLLSLVFSPQSNLLQEVLLDEAVRCTDALSRAGFVVLGRSLVDAALIAGIPATQLQPLRTLAKTVLPQGPGGILSREDQEALVAIRKISALAGISLPGLSRPTAQVEDHGGNRAALSHADSDSSSSIDLRQLAGSAQSAGRAFLQLRPGIQAFTERFLRKLLSRVLRRSISSVAAR
mmetsp:Transcript_38060/g.89069  ORF Transcript_38060/g.89069 Transcript_38060/m.89069 type:complete len:807 (-) Transcript_38060:260-2680(-)